ncbi:Fc.00g005950.m01.CDS01 [Cosmosporella sp. VM-42]
MRHHYGDEGVWNTFLEIRKRRHSHLLSKEYTPVIRDHILAAALNDRDRMATLFEFAQQLRNDENYEWPALYTKVVNFYLEQTDYETAYLWHMRLVPTFPPSIETFGAVLSGFVVDPTPRLQSTLTAMYVFSTHRKLYDYLIPALFESGQSKLARSWRKKLIMFQDMPETSRSLPFLQFLTRYYPKLSLVKEELEVADLDEATAREIESRNWTESRSAEPTGMYSDTFTAQWFATSWTSAEFAINLVHKLGVRSIGPKSLQSLALREDDAQGVSDRIIQIEKLGITIRPRTYSKALVFFAKQREEDLLTALLRCDIHPDEFEDMDSRERLMATSVKQQDWKRERLLQGIEWAIEDRPSSQQLNLLLRRSLSRGNTIGKARLVLDRMETLNVPMAQNNSTALLQRVFQDLRWFPVTRKEYFDGHRQSPTLDRAINITRRVACHDVAIPLRYWSMLLYNLGRLGRFEELEQLCLEIVQLYSPAPGGLIPVHRYDLPAEPENGSEPAVKNKAVISTDRRTKSSDFFQSSRAEETNHHGRYSEAFWKAEMGIKYKKPEERRLETEEEETSRYSHYPEEFLQAEIGEKLNDAERTKVTKPRTDTKASLQKQRADKKYIPADLPFSHREHPVQRIFDPKLQRAIVRWGFDQTLRVEPVKSSLTDMAKTGLADYDVACGVYLLATLRDEGVLIDKQLIRSTVLSRIAVAQVPGRARYRGRDNQELSAGNIKALVDKAWGSEILPPIAQLLRELENYKPKLWNRYPRLFQKAYKGEEEDSADFEDFEQDFEQDFERAGRRR